MVGEWVWGVVSSLAGLVAILSVSVYFLLNRVPTPDQLFAIGEALIDAKIKEFGFGPTKDGRAPEGFIDKILAIPGVQQYIGNMIQKVGNQGLGGGYIGP